MRADPPLPPVFTRADARARGLTDNQITYRVSTGVWKPVRRGWFTVAGTGPDLAEIKAAYRANRGSSAVVSHVSAARVWGLPTPLNPTPEIVLTVPSGKTRRRHGLRVLAAPLLAGDVDTRGRATSAARTVVDCARSLAPRDALAIADAALRQKIVTASGLEAVLGRQAGWPGIARARSVLALADGRRESPLESWSAWAFHEAGLPAPDWQMRLHRPNGTFVARVDALWPGGLVGEADGRAKYAADGDVGRAYEDEKRRETALRDLGAEVIRWYPEDVLSDTLFPTLHSRIARHLLIRRDFQGRVLR